MTTRFNFSALPPEVAAVLRDALNWRNARDASQDAVAEAQLVELDRSTAQFKLWCMAQGELLHHDLDDGLMQVTPPRPIAPPAPDTPREARKKRIAKGALRAVEED